MYLNNLDKGILTLTHEEAIVKKLFKLTRSWNTYTVNSTVKTRTCPESGTSPVKTRTCPESSTSPYSLYGKPVFPCYSLDRLMPSSLLRCCIFSCHFAYISLPSSVLLSPHYFCLVTGNVCAMLP